MTASWILGGLACLSFVLLLWQWLVARRFPLHRRVSDESFTPGVTLLKPLKGMDETTADNLRSWLAQDYAGEVQVLFGVASASDPVCEIVRDLLREFPGRDAQLVVCSESKGVNPKVSKLIELQRLAKHDIIVVSDADVRAPPDLLTNLVALLMPRSCACNGDLTPHGSFEHHKKDGSPALKSAGVAAAEAARFNPGLVTCLYQLANPKTHAMRWEAVAVNVDFWSQVLQAQSIARLDFALGAVMAVRRDALESIGGFSAFANCLADDYQLGHRLVRAGWRIELCPVVVECWSEPLGWRAVWRHQLRWARTIRACKPLPYLSSILSNPTLWPLLWVLARPTAFIAAIAGTFLVTRLFIAHDLMRRLSRVRPGAWLFWAVPLKDLLQVGVWALAFVGHTVEWRGQRYRLGSGGEMTRSG
ncbi:MAG: glycosyltransferase [Verrucomicrobiae bacterium]|nr:glycosyltransferase [Verrucomicrobiae bacterium]MDW7980607.1 glycosyltransferase [Verrucomicrobiales bacterium]